ncbi:MAG: 16S rRNA (guanine(527)-N(7))-methyltransferase RsmG [Pseudomonadota bacterium]|nr:16S rRNA (guanine(527)-N(7))-methyltransferase RsmG [Pseudomonadota bacterium]
MGLSLSNEQLHTLLRFIGLLGRWNAVYNLTAVRDPALMLTHHLCDCLAAVQPLRRKLETVGGKRLLDVGSGGGLPGVVFAVAEPALEVICVDSVGKKAAFVRQVAGELELRNLTVLHARVERVDVPRFDVIASRAYAALPEIVERTAHLLAPGGIWLAMKGKTPTGEITQLSGSVQVFHVEQVKVPDLGADRCLVWMKPLH